MIALILLKLQSSADPDRPAMRNHRRQPPPVVQQEDAYYLYNQIAKDHAAELVRSATTALVDRSRHPLFLQKRCSCKPVVLANTLSSQTRFRMHASLLGN